MHRLLVLKQQHPLPTEGVVEGGLDLSIDPAKMCPVGAEIDPGVASARAACERLLEKGVLSKETHRTVVRLAPPLVIARDDLDWALDRFADVLRELDGVSRRADAALALA